MALLGTRDVGAIALGTGKFAFGGGSFEQSLATIEAAVDAGVVLVDTALAYTRPGIESYAESIVAEALRRYGTDRIVVATKGGHWRQGDEFPVDDRPSTLRKHVEISLRNLGVDAIDLYFIHHPDPDVPIEESLGALEELRWEGKLRSLGLSNVDADMLARAVSVSPVSAVQNRLSFARPEDLPMAVQCEEAGILYMAYQPFDGSRMLPGAAVQRVAQRLDASTNRVMLSWLRTQSPSIIPVVGASRPETIRDSAALLTLSATDRAMLDAAATSVVDEPDDEFDRV